MNWMKTAFDEKHRDVTVFWGQLGPGITGLAGILGLLVSGWLALALVVFGFPLAYWLSRWLNTPIQSNQTRPPTP